MPAVKRNEKQGNMYATIRLIRNISVVIAFWLVFLLSRITVSKLILLPILMAVILFLFGLCEKAAGTKLPLAFFLTESLALFTLLPDSVDQLMVHLIFLLLTVLTFMATLLFCTLKRRRYCGPGYAFAEIRQDFFHVLFGTVAVRRGIFQALILLIPGFLGTIGFADNGYWCLAAACAVVCVERFDRILTKGKGKVLAVFLGFVVGELFLAVHAPMIFDVIVAVICLAGICLLVPGQYLLGNICMGLLLPLLRNMLSDCNGNELLTGHLAWTLLGTVLVLALCFGCRILYDLLFKKKRAPKESQAV